MSPAVAVLRPRFLRLAEEELAGGIVVENGLAANLEILETGFRGTATSQLSMVANLD
jgi:hypothetical protein